uniref:Alanine and arginine-rich domain-containing protein n=1 Tax=Pogona vitticeps TaxID=103695 RepID=A0ABM5GCJ5_9SAUR
MSAETSPGEETFSSLLLEELKQRLLQAFRGERPGPPCPAARQLSRRDAEGKSGGRAAQEELRRAHLEGAMAWLRVELLEMKSQNQKLARTLLDISTEIQRLRNENDLSAAVESETLNMATISE